MHGSEYLELNLNPSSPSPRYYECVDQVWLEGGGGRGEGQGERAPDPSWNVRTNYRVNLSKRGFGLPNKIIYRTPPPPLNHQKIYLNPCTLHVLANIRSCSVTPNNTVTFISESVYFF